MEFIPCPNCGAFECEPFRKVPSLNGTPLFQAVRCPDCQLVYLNPRPRADELPTFYGPSYYGMGTGVWGALYQPVARFFLRRRRGKIERFRRPGRLLDVGCGTGAFLREMQAAGWEVAGVDPNPDVEGSVEGPVRDRITFCELGEAGFPEDHFDVASLWHVLEHAQDPWALLKETRRVLKEDGLLFISVPNILGLQSKICRNRWFHLDLPRHLYHFSPKTLEELIRREGFVPCWRSGRSLEYNLVGWFQSQLNLLGCEPNLFYRLLKKGDIQREEMPLGRLLYSAILAAFLTPALLPACLLLDTLTAFPSWGGVLEMACRKGPLP